MIYRNIEVLGRIEPYAVDLEFGDPVQTHIANEVLSAVVGKIQLLEAGECFAKVLGRIRTACGVSIELTIWKLSITVVEDAIKYDVNASLVTFIDQSLQSGYFVLWFRCIVRVQILHREVLERNIAPIEASVFPGCPWHDLDGIY